MSENAKKAKENYDLGFWGEEKLKKLVAKGWITADEFKLITGKAYA